MGKFTLKIGKECSLLDRSLYLFSENQVWNEFLAEKELKNEEESGFPKANSLGLPLVYSSDGTPTGIKPGEYRLEFFGRDNNKIRWLDKEKYEVKKEKSTPVIFSKKEDKKVTFLLKKPSPIEKLKNFISRKKPKT